MTGHAPHGDSGFPPADFVSAWTAGYNACKDGVPNEAEAIFAALREAWHMDSRQLAQRVADGTLDEADREKIAQMRTVIGL